MGRPGGGSSGHRSGSSRPSRGGSSRSHSGSRSSFSSSNRRRPGGGFSSGTGYNPPPPMHGPAGGSGYGPRPPRPPRMPRYSSYGGGYRRSSGCAGIFAWVVIFLVIIAFMLFNFISQMFQFSKGKQYGSNVIDENIVYEQAQQFYSDNFSDENHALLYYAYLEENESDSAYLVIGDNAIKKFDDRMQDKFWEVYDDYYYSDVNEAEWLGYTFEDMAAVIADERGAIVNDKGFDASCYSDKLNWIGSSGKNTLLTGLRTFYETTGIQPYIVLIDYEKLPGVVISTGNNSTVLKVLIVCVAIILIVLILFKWWKKVQERKKEETEATERILNTPLEKFGDTSNKDLNDLMDKYDK